LKGKEVDIDKAIHYLEMVKERDYSLWEAWLKVSLMLVAVSF
jgi:hypothetical protein